MDAGRDLFAAAADPAMLVVTAATTDGRDGCLVGFHTQSSIDPWRYTVFLSRTNATYRRALRAEALMVHLLDDSQFELAIRFGSVTADDGFDKFSDVRWSFAPDGRTPSLDDVTRWFFGRVERVHDPDGDHVAFELSEIASCSASDPAPKALRLSDVAGLHPGHEA